MGSSSARVEGGRRARLTLALLGGLACVASLSCAARPLPPASARKPAAALEAIDYRLSFDEALRSLDVQLCFRGDPPPELVCGTRGGSSYLTRAWVESAGGRKPLAVRSGRIALAGVASGVCVGYQLDLEGAAQGWGIEAARRGPALAVNLALLLWRPMRFQDIAELSAEVVMPPGMRALVPWQPAPLRVGVPADARAARYTLDQSALGFYGFGVFGRFEVEHVTGPGVTLEAAVLEGLTDATRAHVKPWLEAAARTAALSIGRLARPRVLVVVLPVPSDRQPVRFGMAARGGGASLLLLVAENAGLDALVRDWIAVDEFSHFMHPFVERSDAWLSEGLATYYQEVARVRAGVLPEAEAWQRLYTGSLRAAGATVSLARESAEMFERHSFSKVYWAGAAFALLADAELRQRSGGRRSLDDVMRGLAECCAQNARPMPARAVIAEMDRIAGEPVFSELMQRFVLGPQLPELAPLFTRLGINAGPDGLRLEPSEVAWIRAAIMSGVAEPNGLAAAE